MISSRAPCSSSSRRAVLVVRDLHSTAYYGNHDTVTINKVWRQFQLGVELGKYFVIRWIGARRACGVLALVSLLLLIARSRIVIIFHDPDGLKYCVKPAAAHHEWMSGQHCNEKSKF